MRKRKTIKKRILGFLLTAAVAASCFTSEVGTLIVKAEPWTMDSNENVIWTGDQLTMEGASSLPVNNEDLWMKTGSTLTIAADATGTLNSLTIDDANIVVENNSTAGVTINYVDTGTALLVNNAGGRLTVTNTYEGRIRNNGANFTCSAFTSKGAVENSGVFICTSYTGTGTLTNNAGANLNVSGTYDCTGQLSNTGTISARNFVSPTSGSSVGNISANSVTWKKGCANNGTVIVSAGARSLTFSGFSNGESVGTGVFVTDGNATITNPTKAVYNLQAAPATSSKQIDDITDSVPARELMKEAPSISSTLPVKFYCGENYDPADYFVVVHGGAISFSYEKLVSGTYQPIDAKPTEVGDYKIIVKTAATNDYRDTGTYFPENTDTYRIEYMPQPALCTIDETPIRDNGYDQFFNTPVTLRAPAGYSIRLEGADDEEFTHTVTIDEETYHMGIFGQYKDDNTEALSAPDIGLYGNIAIDYSSPVILQDTAYDQDDVAIKTTIKDGATLNARSVYFNVHDHNGNGNALETVTVDGTGIEVDEDTGSAQVVLKLKRALPGKQTFKIVATDEYTNTSTWNITLNYLPTPTPKTPFTAEGKKGNNGFFIEDVKLVPVEGYLISDNVNGVFNESIVYKPGMEHVWLMKEANEAYTEAIDVPAYKIDKDNPTFPKFATDLKGNSVELKEGGVYATRKLSFSVTDANLASVTVNDIGIPVTDGKADIDLAALTKKDFKIVAEDLAGNQSKITVTLDHKRTEGKATIAIKNIYYGMIADPELSTNSDNLANATVYYKKADTGDENYSTANPLSVGNYIAKVIVPISDDYTEATATTEFEITYLPTPTTPYSLDGTRGNNDYFKSDVELVAPEGFVIASSVSDEGSRRVPYTEDMTGFYLRRVDNGATTAFIPFTETIKIDKDIPKLAGDARDQSGQSFGLHQGEVYMADTMTFTIIDDNLMSLTINGTPVTVYGGKAVVSLDAMNGIKDFVIAAEDEAGNVYNLKITLMATWYKDKIIPIGERVPLTSGEQYKLGGGIWRVNNGQTLYPGGGAFYVLIPGDYTFVVTE